MQTRANDMVTGSLEPSRCSRRKSKRIGHRRGRVGGAGPGLAFIVPTMVALAGNFGRFPPPKSPTGVSNSPALTQILNDAGSLLAFQKRTTLAIFESSSTV